MSNIVFRFAARKAFAALHWIVSEQATDLHTALKACYFADKEHLNLFHRPIFGANYRAMRFGPVPLEIYEMAKGEPLWLAETGGENFPWALRGHQLRLHANVPEDRSLLSETDIDAFASGLALSRSMSFTERTAATHGSDWQAARLGTMRYEDMLDDTPEKPDVIEYLRENGRFMKL